jgi:simple sugar transport system permease protein
MNILADIITQPFVYVPLLLVALGGMFSERSGIINIALEGIMIIGALCSCLFLRVLDDSGFGPAHPQLRCFYAVIVAALCGAVFALLLAFASVNPRRIKRLAARR